MSLLSIRRLGQTLYSNTTGTTNDAFGMQALYNNTTGTDNTAVGHTALYNNTTGVGNTAVGSNAGRAGTGNTVGTYNTFIGYSAQANANNYTNGTALGANAILTSSNTIILGDSNITTIRANTGTIQGLSDRRRKKDIRDTNLGLDFIDRLRPVSYRFNNGDETLRYGFIAQEVEQALPSALRGMAGESKPESGENGLALLARDSDKDRTWCMSYSELIAPLVKFVQELKADNDDLREQVAMLSGSPLPRATVSAGSADTRSTTNA